MKKCSISSVIRKCKLSNSKLSNYRPIKIYKIKKLTIPIAGDNKEQSELACIVGRKAK